MENKVRAHYGLGDRADAGTADVEETTTSENVEKKSAAGKKAAAEK